MLRSVKATFGTLPGKKWKQVRLKKADKCDFSPFICISLKKTRKPFTKKNSNLTS